MNHSGKNHKLPQPDRKETWDRRLQIFYRARPALVKGLTYLVVSLLVIITIFYPRQYITTQKYQVGEVANKTIRVLRDLEVQDLVSTQQYQKAAAEQTPEVYDFSPKTSANINQKLADFFSEMRELYQLSPKPAKKAFASASCGLTSSRGFKRDVPTSVQEASHFVRRRGFPVCAAGASQAV
jgi:membrane-associated HD superfamily phosphohydrolase